MFESSPARGQKPPPAMNFSRTLPAGALPHGRRHFARHHRRYCAMGVAEGTDYEEGMLLMMPWYLKGASAEPKGRRGNNLLPPRGDRP